MEKISWRDAPLRPLGRTLAPPGAHALYFDWTVSGIEVFFRGTCLMAEFTAMAGEETDVEALTGRTLTRPTWPWLAVVLDDENVPVRRLALEQPESIQLLFQSDQEEYHRVRVVKLTENGKGFAGLRGFRMEGTLCPPPARPPRRRIEFIGDSITCGFGNEALEKDRLYFSSDENGWMSHGAVTARLLDMDANVVSSSGICLTRFDGWPHPYAMDELYPYADRMLEDRLGMKTYTPWDFAEAQADYVVLNLGTNDANAIQQAGPGAAERWRRAYQDFLKTLRAAHGPRAQLICALGSMDYYLYRDIQSAVEAYRRESGDAGVCCFRYPKMDLRDPVGAEGHPHTATHQKMARAMAEFIAGLEREGKGS